MTTPVFTFTPNWSVQPAESLEWLTDVQTAYDGTEVRRKVRQSPRRALSFAVTLTTSEMQRVDAWLHQYQVADVIMPVWTDGYRLPTSGEVTSFLDGDFFNVPGAGLLDYRAGGLLVVIHGDGSTSTRTVSFVASSAVSFDAGGTITFAAGDRIYPGRLSRLTSSIDVERVTAGVVNVSIVARFIDDTSLEAGAWPTEYRGAPVLDLQPNRVSPVAASLSRITQTIDYALGKWRRFDRAGRAFSSRSHEHVLNGRAEIDAFRRFLHGRNGRVEAFWCPNWQADLTIRSISGTSLVIDTIGWAAAYGVGYVGRQDVMLRLRDGTAVYRRVLSSVVDGGEETLTLDSDPGVTASDVAQCCWLDVVRLAADDVTLEWLTAGVARVSVGVRALGDAIAFVPPDPPAPSIPDWPEVASGEDFITFTSGWESAGAASATLDAMGASLSGGAKWTGGVLAPNGLIYTIPLNATDILITNPATGTATRSAMGATLAGSTKWYGGTLAPNGLIYGVPLVATNILIIDPVAGTATRSNMGATLDISVKWAGGVLAPNGLIYTIPLDAADILIIDPAAGTATRSAMGASLGGSEKYLSGVLGPDGKIYCIPYSAADILIIDPVAGTATRSAMGATLAGSTKWAGGVLGPDGKIYCIPYNATDILIIDPVAGTATRSNMGATLTGATKWSGGQLGSDGKIYAFPRSAADVLIIDPVAGTATRSALGSGLAASADGKYNGGTLALNGKIYGTPWNATQNLIIDPNGTGDTTNAALSPYLNKF